MVRGGKREGAGRTPLSEEEKRKQRSVWLTDAEWEYLENNLDDYGNSKSEKVRNIVVTKIEEDKSKKSVD